MHRRAGSPRSLKRCHNPKPTLNWDADSNLRDGVDGKVDPVEPYDTDAGANISIARNIELTGDAALKHEPWSRTLTRMLECSNAGIEYANMRSKVERFSVPDPLEDKDFGGQDLKTIGRVSPDSCSWSQTAKSER